MGNISGNSGAGAAVTANLGNGGNSGGGGNTSRAGGTDAVVILRYPAGNSIVYGVK